MYGNKQFVSHPLILNQQIPQLSQAFFIFIIETVGECLFKIRWQCLTAVWTFAICSRCIFVMAFSHPLCGIDLFYEFSIRCVGDVHNGKGQEIKIFDRIQHSGVFNRCEQRVLAGIRGVGRFIQLPEVFKF